MGLKEVMDETKKQLEEAERAAKEAEEQQQKENAEEKKNIEEAKAEVKEEKKEEVKEEKQEEKTEEVRAESKIKTNADYARERKARQIEAERLRAELEAANAKIAELSKPKEEVKADAEPNKEEDPVSWADWRARQAEKKAEEANEKATRAAEKLEKEERRRQAEAVVTQAQNELIELENQFKQDHPDFDDVKKYYVNTLAFSLKNLNPKMTNDALAKAVTNQILMTASQYYNEGYENPVAVIYENVKAMGYQPPKEEKEAEEKKPDLARVAKNKERNAGMAGSAGGAGKGEMTKQYAATELTAAEWARLPIAERERLMRW